MDSLEITKKGKFGVTPENNERVLQQLIMSKNVNVNKYPYHGSEIDVYCVEVAEDQILAGGVLVFGRICNTAVWESVCVRVAQVPKEIYFTCEAWESCSYVIDQLQSEGKIWNVKHKETTRKRVELENTVQVKCVKVSYLSQYGGIHKNFTLGMVAAYQEEPVEGFVIKTGVRGLGWIRVSGFEVCTSQISNCKHEILVSGIKQVEVVGGNTQGYITAMTLEICIENSKVSQISWAVFKNFDPIVQNKQLSAESHTIISCPKDFSSEKALLNHFLMKMFLIDADLILGCKLNESLYLLIRQLRLLDAKNWSRLGKLKRARFPNENLVKTIMLGRILCDEIPDCSIFSEIYDSLYKSCLLPTSVLISNITGALWSKVLTCGNLHRNEYIIMHELHKAKHLWPETKTSQSWNRGNNQKKKDKFKGGLVLDPLPGIYDFIIHMDFIGLYPSIIQEFQICFTGDKILPGILEKIIRQRLQILSIMKEIPEESERNLLDAKQKALKNLANSLYGSFGCEYFRFYRPEIAEKIARNGREILEKAADVVKTFGFNVIYGDTDSLMVNPVTSRICDVISIGTFLAQRINQNFRYVKIAVRCIYERFFLMQKNYAGIVVGNSEIAIDIKGLVRGNYSEFCKNLIRKCVEIVLKSNLPNMLEFAKSEISQASSLNKDLFLITEHGRNAKNKILKLLPDKSIDYNYYIEKEINPFIQKVSWILNPTILDTSLYFLCPTNPRHKVYIIQDSILVTDCRECLGFTNQKQILTDNQAKNIITLNLKQQVQTMYSNRKALNGKIGKRVNNITNKLFKLESYSENMQNNISLLEFNMSLVKIREALFGILDDNAVERVLRKSRVFKVNMRRYAIKCDYSAVFR